MNKKIVIISELLLTLTTLIWGFAFAFQNIASKTLGTFTINASRSIVSAIFLFATSFIVGLVNKKKKVEAVTNYKTKDLVIGGILCGFFLYLAMGLQQAGISLEGAGKSGFLTAMYIIFVPFVGYLFKKKADLKIVACLVVATIGVFLINVSSEGVSFSVGSILLLGCAFAYAFQILFVDMFANKCDAIKLTAVQSLVCGILSAITMLIVEEVVFTDILSVIVPILFLGILSSGVAYTLQTYTQKNLNANVASLIMSLESVFACVGGMILLNEMLSGIQFVGCALIFIAILFNQIDFKKKVSESVLN